MNHVFGPHDPLHRAAWPQFDSSPCSEMLFERFRQVVKRHRFKLAILDPEHPAETCATDPGGACEHGLEHGLKVAWRAGDDLEHVGGGGLLLQRFAQLIEQSRIFNRDNRLRGEILNQCDLLIGEWLHLLAIDGDCPHQLVLFEHWNDEERTSTGALDELDKSWVAFEIGWCHPDVSNMNGFLGSADAGERNIRMKVANHDIQASRLCISGRCVVQRGRAKCLSIVKEQITEISFTQADGVLQDGGENWLKLTRRT